jgi:diaminohydroxyphosphoribosylaminopyrimidine deaminase/5-amino-6-(5-phosphoribosylamino)uracil reductase
VGGGTLRADAPGWTCACPVWSAQPARWVLTRGQAPQGWNAVADIAAPQAFGSAQWLFVEGGRGRRIPEGRHGRSPAALSRADPGRAGAAAVANLGLETLDAGAWPLGRNRACQLGSDTLTIYHRRR